jgi:hypothetical protein
MSGEKILQMLESGFTLHSGFLGFWMIDPMDSSCINVNHNAAKALARKGLIHRATGSDGENSKWEAGRPSDAIGREIIDRLNYFYLQTDGSMKFPNSAEGDILKMVHKFFNHGK